MLKEQLQFISDGGSVVRYHTAPGIKPNTNAHHSHGVAMLCYLLWSNAGKLPRPELLMAALTHDLAEQVASDVSAPTKRLLNIQAQLHALENKVLMEYNLEFESQLTEYELRVLKLADTMDGLLYTCRELALGNRNYQVIWGRWEKYIGELRDTLDWHELNVLDAITDIHREVTSVAGPQYNCFAE